MSLTACTIQQVLSTDNPNEGRVKINNNFECLQDTITDLQISSNTGSTVVSASTNIDVSLNYSGGVPFYSVSVVNNPVFDSLSANSISADTYYVGSVDLSNYLSASSVFTSGSSGSYSIKANNDSGLDATGDYSYVEGQNTTASGPSSHAEGAGTIAIGDFSHAEGYATIASGQVSHAEGQNTTANGDNSHTEGENTVATGSNSHAEGNGTTTIGPSSHSEGSYTTAIGGASHAEGNGTTAVGLASHSEGWGSWAYGAGSHAEGGDIANGYTGGTAMGISSHAEGALTTALGNYSHAEGYGTIASGSSSHSEGEGTTAFGDYSHAEGTNTTAFGEYSHSEGLTTIATGQSSHAEGRLTLAGGLNAHAEGYNTSATGINSHAEGGGSIAEGDQSHAEGEATTALGISSHAEGSYTTALGVDSHAEGLSTMASGDTSHAEGHSTFASGLTSHAEGNSTTAIGEASHSQGAYTAAIGTYSHAEGNYTIALGNYSHAEGVQTISSGSTSHSEGLQTTAFGDYSHAEGDQTIASGQSSHAEGIFSSAIGSGSHAEGGYFDGFDYYSGGTAIGDASHAEGVSTTASGIQSHAEGSYTTAIGTSSHAEGFGTTASGTTSHAEGFGTKALGSRSHAEGSQTTASGGFSHTEGQNTTAFGHASHAEGSQTTASGGFSHAEGSKAEAIGNASHAEGNTTIASGQSSHAEGYVTKAFGDYSHAEGEDTIASGVTSHAEGGLTTAIGEASHAEGNNTRALGDYSHAEGQTSMASGVTSHAEGQNTTAIGEYSHSEGSYTTASGETSHAEGYLSKAFGDYSHTEGQNTTAFGQASHSEGRITTAFGDYSHAGGLSSIASGVTSFVHGSGSTANGNGTIVLGNNITGSTDNTTYVNALNIKSIGNGASVFNLGWDSNGNVVSGSTFNSGLIYITNKTTGVVTYYATLELATSGATSGDTIYVNPGTYTVTTTATNGLAKSGVNWYFNQGAIVNKATTGHLFNDTGFANGITIDGSGVFNLTSLAYSFCYLTKTSSKINLYNVTSTTSYAIFDLSLLEGAGSTTIGGVGSININLNNATSSGGVVFTLNGSTSATQINIYFNMLKSTASYVLNGGNQTKLFLSGNLIYSTATYAIFGIQNYSVVVANVREINGVTYGWYLSSLGGAAYIESTSKTNGIYFNGSGSYFTQNAHCDTYYVVDGWVRGQSFINLTQTSGYFNGAYIGSNSAPAWSISGGVSEIDCRNNTVGSSRLSFNITGGKVFINGYYQEDSHTRSRVINGANAEVTFNNAQFICNGTAASEVYGGMIILTNGKLRLNNTKFQQGLTTYLEPLIKWTAGTVICNGFVATATNVYTNIFQATTAGLNLKVLSAGLSTSLLNNGGTIAAKKMKYKMTVSSVASTSITLNDGSGGNETFAESDTGVYSTTALLAQRMASLINVSATLDITASQDNPGTDVYFYIEMDTAGLAFTIPTVVNLTSLQVCMNSYLITNITGGSILENSNVE